MRILWRQFYRSHNGVQPAVAREFTQTYLLSFIDEVMRLWMARGQNLIDDILQQENNLSASFIAAQESSISASSTSIQSLNLPESVEPGPDTAHANPVPPHAPLNVCKFFDFLLEHLENIYQFKDVASQVAHDLFAAAERFEAENRVGGGVLLEHKI